MVDSFFLSLVVAGFVGAAASYLGSLMITRRMALVGDALGHVALPGMGLALLLKIDSSIGAFVFLIVGILLVWRLGESTSLSLEIPVGIVFVASLALGFLIVPQPELLESLIGDISRVSWEGAMIAIALSIFVIAVIRRIYPAMTLISISSDLARVEGFSRDKYDLLYLSAIAVTVSIGVKVTGSLLVGALVIVPPATARMLSANIKQYSAMSIGIGSLGGVLGMVTSAILKWPAGPAIILVSSLLFAMSLVVKRLRSANLQMGSKAGHPGIAAFQRPFRPTE